MIRQSSTDAAAFSDALRQYGEQMVEEAKTVLDLSAEAVHQSIVHGSSITNSPGQPVADGDLRDSWKMHKLSASVIEVYSDSPYARAIEHNWKRIARAKMKAAGKRMGLTRLTKSAKVLIRKRFGGMRFRNGGAHSVKLTARGFPRLVESVVAVVFSSGSGGVRVKGIGIDPFALRKK